MQRRRPDKKKVILGISGSFGSGKTTVAGIFKSYKAKIIDADKLAHACIIPGSPAYKKIIAVFGRGILKESGVINRKALAGLVFGNKGLLRRLNRIVHPEVIKVIKDKIRQAGPGLIILDAPLLIEADLKKIVDKLIIVKASRKEQFARLAKRDALRPQDILRRIRSQIPLRKKARLADFVIDNGGTLKKTRKQAAQIRRQVWRN